MLTTLKRKIRAFAARDQAVILTYHSVVDAALPFPVWQHLERNRFEEQLARIAQNFRCIALSELLSDMQRGRMQPYSVVLTFDDGFRNNLLNVLPLAQKYDVPITLFLTTAPLNTTNLLWPEHLLVIVAATARATLPFGGRSYATATPRDKADSYRLLARAIKNSPVDTIPGHLARLSTDAGLTDAVLRAHPLWTQLQFLSWEEIRTLQASGRVEFGAHTINHWRLTHLPEERARQEIAESRATLQREIGPIRYFAYPHGVDGDFTEAHRMLAVGAGYDAVFTAFHGTVTPLSDRTALPRVGVGSDMSLAELDYLLHGGVARMNR